MLVVKSAGEWDDGEWADLVELFDIFVNLNIFQGVVDLLDVLNEPGSSGGLASRVKIGIVVVEEEWGGALEVLILIMVVIFKDEFKMVVVVSVGWTSNGSSLDFLEDGVDHGERVLGVSLNSEKSVDDTGSDGDSVNLKASILEFQVVDSETS